MAKKRVATTGAAAATKLAAAATAASAAGSHVKDQARSQAGELGDRIGPALEDARDRLTPVVADARDRLTPVVTDARDRLTPVVTDARDRLTPVVDDARERLVDLTGTVATRIDEALPDKYTPAVVTARVPAHRRPNRFLQALFVLGLGGVAAAIAHRVTSHRSQPAWRTAPGQPDTTAVKTAEPSVDVAGGTPEEVAADATDTPHAVTTPDAPAHKVVLD